MRTIRECLRYRRCLKIGGHIFKWHWLLTDSVYECRYPQCTCGEYRVERFENQSADAKYWCDKIAYPKLEDSKKVSFNDNWLINLIFKRTNQ